MVAALLYMPQGLNFIICDNIPSHHHPDLIDMRCRWGECREWLEIVIPGSCLPPLSAIL